MTPEQIKDLTDTELNRAMIWLYADEGIFVFIDLPHLLVTSFGGSFLHDWNITMPLAVKSDLTLQPAKSSLGWFAYNQEHSSHLHKDPLRAICEVLVKIAMERNNVN